MAATSAPPADRPFSPSANLAFLKPSATIAVSQRAKALKAEGRDVIDLGVGEPDFPTPAPIIAAAKAALDAGATKYTATEGILPLREAIAAMVAAEAGGAHAVHASEVVVSTGAKQSLFNACFALFGPGDDVLIPAPSWTSYVEMVALARANVVPVPGDPANGLKVSAAALAAAATPATKGVILNSPSNPTGAIFTRDELAEILTLADERGWWVISDEIYGRIAYEAPATPALAVASSRDRLVVVGGVAKAWAMTGWRIGWTVSSAPLARAMTAFQSHATSNPATVSQHAALAAVRGGADIDAAVTAMVREFRARRDACLAVLAREPGIQVVHPDGAFYLYMRVDGCGLDGDAFARQVLETQGAAVVPGSAFLTPAWIRMSYAAPLEQAVEGVRRIVACWRAHRGTA
jgi:aspartate aminotransferase